MQDNTRGHNWKDTVTLLNSSLKTNYEDLLEFDESTTRMNTRNKIFGHKDRFEPIGSGCVAQVYKAKLKKPVAMLPAGSDVAVKVTHRKLFFIDKVYNRILL